MEEPLRGFGGFRETVLDSVEKESSLSGGKGEGGVGDLALWQGGGELTGAGVGDLARLVRGGLLGAGMSRSSSSSVYKLVSKLEIWDWEYTNSLYFHQASFQVILLFWILELFLPVGVRMVEVILPLMLIYFVGVEFFAPK